MRLLTVIFAATLLLAGLAPLAARAGTSLITTTNYTDAYIWLTAYERPGRSGPAHAWCIEPKAKDWHTIDAKIWEVRAQISHGGCQRDPILFDATRSAIQRATMGVYRSDFNVGMDAHLYTFRGY